MAWHILNCIGKITPFSNTANRQLFETNPVKKISKVITTKHATDEHSLFDQINNVMDDPDPEFDLNKYFQPKNDKINVGLHKISIIFST